jgi:hypothetical protein
VDVAVAALVVEGDVDTRAGRPRDASARYRDAEELARRLAWPGARARALAGLAAALEASRDVPGALAAYARAEEALDDASLLVPLGAGRSTFVASNAASARGRVALLAAQGDGLGALAAIQQARARLGRGLALRSALANLGEEGRARWEAAMSAHRAARAAIEADVEREWLASADEGARVRARRRDAEKEDAGDFESTVAELVGRSAAPSPAVAIPDDALVLAFHPSRAGWVGVAARAGRAEVRPLPAPDPAGSPDAIAAALLAPFDASIAAATRVRFALPAGLLDDVALHLLPWRGQPLVASVEVEHSAAALPISGPSACDGAAPLRALVVSDPGGDLPAARAEAVEVLEHLRARVGGTDIDPLAQAEATGASVRASLPRAQLFHFAGHATPAAEGAWEGALSLHGSTRIDVADVLALREVPACVFLSSCEGARSVGDGFGIAQAFVFAGSHTVVASIRRVDDGAAKAFANDFYAALRAEPGVPRAFAVAQRGALARGDTATAAAYRLLVP